MSISVIIPVHNSEKYLKDCLDALINSIPEDTEIIIVDDGSTDRSCEIYSEFISCNSDLNIKAVYQEWAGVSAARNNGLSLSTKEYICFLDSDDVCKIDMHKKLIRTAVEAGADFCYCGFCCCNDDMTEEIRHFDISRYISGKGSDVVSSFITDKTYICISTFIVKKEIIDRYNIYFTKEYRYGEDDEFTLKCLIHSENVIAVKEETFNYRISQSGVTAVVSLKRFDNSLACINFYEYVKRNFQENISLMYTLRYIYIPMSILNTFYLFAQDGKEYKNVFEYMKKLGLTEYLKKAKGARPELSLMIFLWNIHPKILFNFIYFKNILR